MADFFQVFKFYFERKFSLYIFLLISLQVFTQEVGFPVVRNYSSKEDARIHTVFCSVQDNRGVIYVGTSNLLEFDGVSWREVEFENYAGCYDLVLGNDGRIYVTTTNDIGFLSTNQQGCTEFKSLMPLITDKSIRLGIETYIKCTKDYVYFSSDKNLLQYSPSKNLINIFKFDSDITGDFVFDNTYFFKLKDIGLIKFDEKSNKTQLQSNLFANNFLYNYSSNYKDSTLVINTPRMGVYTFNPLENKLPQKINIKNDFFENNYLMGSELLTDGAYVLASIDKGAMFFDNKGVELQHYQKTTNLQSNLVYDMFTDKSKNLWLSMDYGISKTEYGVDLSFWDRSTGLDGMIMSIIRFKGTVYIATSTGAYFIDSTNKIQVIGTSKFQQCWTFLITNGAKTLLMGTQTGIFEIDKFKTKHIYKGKNATVLCQSALHPNRIYSTNNQQLISLKYENKQWQFEGLWKDYDEFVYSIAEDKKGDLWVSTYTNGIVRITPNFDNITVPKQIKYYTTKDGLPSLNNLIAYKYKGNVIWATYKGFYHLNIKTDKFVSFKGLGKSFSDGSRDVYMFNEMPNDEVLICPMYVTDTLTVGVLKKSKSDKFYWDYKPFKRIPEKLVSFSYVDELGVIWIATGENIYRYDRTKDRKNYNQDFNCLIRKVSANSDSLLYGGNDLNVSFTNSTKLSSPLSFEYNSISFDFAATFYDHEEANLYSYKLPGFENNWSKWTKETKKGYEKLREGKYTFFVKSKNIYDKESSVATYTFVIKPPIYRTWWAYLFYALVIGFVIFIIVKINIYRLNKKNEDLELIIETRTTEIKVQKEELLKQNEQLVKLDDFKKGMTSMIVHDLKNPLNQIINVSSNLHPMKQIELLQQSGRQMLSMVLNILDVHKYEDTEMELKLADNNLFSVVNNVISQVGFLAERKSIGIENNVDASIFILSDLDVTERIFVNLLSNAVKYTALNGLIVITANKVNDELVQIEVCDNGDGIPEDKKHLVFRKFSQIDAKDSGTVRSTGLGLTFCKMAVEAHGGEIGFYSNKDAGTTFWFRVKEGTGIYSEIENNNNQKADDEIVFTENELAILRPIIQKLDEFSIYESTDIEEILSQIKEPITENINRWIAEIDNCLKSLNTNKYNKLKSIVG